MKHDKMNEMLVRVLQQHKAPSSGALGGMGTRITCECGYIVDGPSFETHIAEKLLAAGVVYPDSEVKALDKHIRRSKEIWSSYAKATSEFE